MLYLVFNPFVLSVALVSSMLGAQRPACQPGQRCSHDGGNSLIQMKKRVNVERSETDSDGCKSWCPTNTKGWGAKCKWKKCKGCADCSASSSCEPWCLKSKKAWDTKCNWKKCKACSTCTSASMSCDSLRTSAPLYSILGGASAEEFVEDTFNKYAVEAIDAVQCRVKYSTIIAQAVPSDPSGKTPNPQYNAYVSTHLLKLSRPIEIGDVLVCPYCLGNPWTDTNPPSPDPYLSVSSDLQAIDPGTNAPFGLPDATVTCANSSHHADVGGMRCAYCEIPSTCLLGMGCFGYFAAECHFDTGSAKEAAKLMVQSLKPAGDTTKPEPEPEPEPDREPEPELEPEPEPEIETAPVAPLVGHCAPQGSYPLSNKEICANSSTPSSCRATQYEDGAYCRWGYCTLYPGGSEFYRNNCETQRWNPGACNSAGNGRICLWCDKETSGGCTVAPTPPPTKMPTALPTDWPWPGCTDAGSDCSLFGWAGQHCAAYSAGSAYWKAESEKCCACGGGTRSSAPAEPEPEPEIEPGLAEPEPEPEPEPELVPQQPGVVYVLAENGQSCDDACPSPQVCTQEAMRTLNSKNAVVAAAARVGITCDGVFESRTPLKPIGWDADTWEGPWVDDWTSCYFTSSSTWQPSCSVSLRTDYKGRLCACQ